MAGKTTSFSGKPLSASAAEIERQLRLLRRPGQVTELRALAVSTPSYRKSHTVSGYFDHDHLADLAKAAAELSGKAQGVYITLNPVDPELISRRCNRVAVAESGELTGDGNIVRREWLLVDADPVRATGISATDSEKAEALATIQKVRDYLHEEAGWPDPFLADSGNGFHLLYRIDAPADDGSLVRRCLNALAERFDSDKVNIDRAVFNAARICKLPGTLAMKGDNTPTRPHRLAKIIEPDPAGNPQLLPVPLAQLEALADTWQEPKPPPRPSTNGTASNGTYNHRLLVEPWLKDRGIEYTVKGGTAKGDRTVYVLAKCPFDPSHGAPDSCIMQADDGQLSAICFHNSCSGRGWKEFKVVIGAPATHHYYPPLTTGQSASPKGKLTDPEPPPPEDALPIMTCGELVRTYPERRPAVIEGLLREGETMNIIASPKTGKSWLTLGLAFAVATGRRWLSTFETAPGNVLLIDNELHPETSAHRLRTLAGTAELPEDIAERVHIVNLRGRLQTFHGFGPALLKIERGRYKLVIIDAWYRVLPAGTDENDNAGMAGLYNALDNYADAMGAAFVLIHHASKGDQSGKSVTDVGAGAGAQSRATDTHLILRPHAEDKVVVLDAAVRSWPPVEPICLRWDFPTWTPAPDLDASDLRTLKPRRRATPDDANPKPPEPPWTARRFADTFGKPEPRARGAIVEAARGAGLPDRKATSLLKDAVECDYLFAWKEAGAYGKTLIASVKPPDPPPPKPETPPAPEPTVAPKNAPLPTQKRSRGRPTKKVAKKLD